MAQSGIILNVQNQLEDILSNQNLIVQNQATMIEKLDALESRLTNVEKILIVGQQIPISIGQALAAQKSTKTQHQHTSLQSSPRQSDSVKISSGGVVMSKEQKMISQKQVSPSSSIIAAAAAAAASAAQVSVSTKLGSTSNNSTSNLIANNFNNSTSNNHAKSPNTNHSNSFNTNNLSNYTNNSSPTSSSSSSKPICPKSSPPNNHTFNNLINNPNFSNINGNSHNYKNNNNNNPLTNINHTSSSNHNRHSPLNLYQNQGLQSNPKLLQQQMSAASLQQQRHSLSRLGLDKIKIGLIQKSQNPHQGTLKKNPYKRQLEKTGSRMDQDEMGQEHDTEEGENIHKHAKMFQNDENLGMLSEDDYVDHYKSKLGLIGQSQSLSRILSGGVASASGQQQQQQQHASFKTEEDDEEDYDEDDDGDDENQQILGLQDYSDQQQLINENDIRRIFAVSKSRGNFAALLVQQMYARHERIMSNVMGTRGKRQLSPNRMLVVKTLAFQMYPPAHEREEEIIWKKECVKAIDSKNRKVRINPGGNYSSSVSKHDSSTPSAYPQFLNLTSTPLSSSHLSRSASASNTAALAAAVAAALSSKQTQQQQQQQQQQYHHQGQTSQFSSGSMIAGSSGSSIGLLKHRESAYHESVSKLDTTVTSDDQNRLDNTHEYDDEQREPGETMQDEPEHETRKRDEEERTEGGEICGGSDLARSVPSNASSATGLNTGMSDCSGDR